MKSTITARWSDLHFKEQQQKQTQKENKREASREECNNGEKRLQTGLEEIARKDLIKSLNSSGGHFPQMQNKGARLDDFKDPLHSNTLYNQ